MTAHVATKTAGRNAKDAKPAKVPAGHRAMEWTKSLIVGFLLFMVLRTFLIQTFRITSGSMENTLLVGDFLVLSKSAYGATVPGIDLRLPGYTEPDRGDIIVFRGHHEPIDLVKRLVGLPGDTLEMRNAVLYVNGRPADESLYAQHVDPMGDGFHPWMTWQNSFLISPPTDGEYRPTRDNWGPLVVPPARYFALGDNRDASLDSRYWGFVDEAQIKGKALVLYFSFDRQPDGFLNHVRWDRIGDRPH